MVREFDVVVLGAGASGMSLLCHLGATGAGRRLQVALVDDGRHVAERSWAFWTAQPEVVDPSVVRTYRRISTHTCGHGRDLGLRPYRYCVVSSTRLRAQACAALPSATWVRARVDAVRPGTPASVDLDDGTRLMATTVFDGRGTTGLAGPLVTGEPLLRLQFTGAHALLPGPAFAPGTATLFDFRVPQDGEARFVYVLPSGPDEAFIELTAFTTRSSSPSPDTALRTLSDYLVRTTGHAPSSLRLEEQGGYPLVQREIPSPGPGVVELGARAGLLKPSTGYAFGRIQRDAAQLAGQVIARAGSPTHERPQHRFPFLDRVFLTAVAGDPNLMENAFDTLLREHGTDAAAPALLRFLDEAGSVGQDLRLVSRLPWRPFVAAVGSRKTWSMRG